LAPFPHIQCLL